jgi:hypothetical protein
VNNLDSVDFAGRLDVDQCVAPAHVAHCSRQRER